MDSTRALPPPPRLPRRGRALGSFVHVRPEPGAQRLVTALPGHVQNEQVLLSPQSCFPASLPQHWPGSCTASWAWVWAPGMCGWAVLEVTTQPESLQLTVY